MDVNNSNYWQNRFFVAIGTQNQKEIAYVLNITQSSVSAGLKNPTPPATWCLALVEEKRINPKWLRFGAPHPQYLLPAITEELSMADVLQSLQKSYPGVKISVSMQPLETAEA